MQTTLAQFNETASTDAFALQNSYLLKVRLDQGAIRAKQGSMVAYQGDVTFEHAGSGGMSKFMKKALTGGFCATARTPSGNCPGIGSPAKVTLKGEDSDLTRS